MEERRNLDRYDRLTEEWMSEHREAIEKLRGRVESILGEYFDEFYEYFRSIAEYVADYKILVARRCLVLYQIFAQFFWLDELQPEKGIVLSDWAIPKFKGEFVGKSLIVVDDILIHGSHIGEICRELERSGVMENTKLFVYMMTDDTKRLPDGLEEKIYCAEIAVGSEWRELSNRIVKAIVASNIPYTSFVGAYTWEGTIEELQKELNFIKEENSKEIQKETGSSTYLLFDSAQEPVIFSRFVFQSCVRAYTNSDSDLLTCIPYCFTKAVKKEKIELFFQKFTQKLTVCPTIKRELSANKKETGWNIYRLNLFDALLSCFYGLYFFRERKDIGKFDFDTIAKSFGQDIAAELQKLSYGQIKSLLKEPFDEIEECLCDDFEENPQLGKCFINLSSDNFERGMDDYLLIYRELSENVLQRSSLRPRGISVDYIFRSMPADSWQWVCAILLNNMDTGKAAAVYGLSEGQEAYASFLPSGEISYQIPLRRYPEIIRQMILLEEEDVNVDNYLDYLEDSGEIDAEEKRELNNFLERNRGELRKWNVVDILENRDLWKRPGVKTAFEQYCESAV